MQRTRLLIVDDHGEVREGLRMMLELAEGLQVVGEAGDGREAVFLVEELQPDVVLMDIVMPVMDGIEATRLIKRLQPRIRVVVLTLYQSYRDDALAAGAGAVLVKGCPVAELLGTVLQRQ